MTPKKLLIMELSWGYGLSWSVEEGEDFLYYKFLEWLKFYHISLIHTFIEYTYIHIYIFFKGMEGQEML